MAEQEYFVRNPDSENARGPFTFEKLFSLAEAGQVDRQSLLYDNASETWKPVGENSELCAKLFPEKKKLTLRRRAEPVSDEAPATAPEKKSKPSQAVAPKSPEIKETDDASVGNAETAPTEKKKVSVKHPDDKTSDTKKTPAPAPEPEPESEQASAPTYEKLSPELSGMEVSDFLNAAEGQTEHMAAIRDEREWRDKAVAISLPMLAVMMLLSAVSLLFSKQAAIFEAITKGFGMHWLPLLEQPRFVLGLADLLLALMLALAVTRLYPLLRLRLMLGLGYLGYIAFAAWVAGSSVGAAEMIALLVFSVGAYVCTLTLRFSLMLLSGLCAIAAAVVLGVLWNFPGVLF